MVNQLPQGWKEEELGKLADVIAGQSPEGIYYNTVGDGTPFYQGKSEFQEMYLGKPTKWTTKVTKLAKRNDILMSVRAPVGPVNITQEDICIGRGLAAITAKSMLLQLYLFYHLKYLEDKISGTNGAVFASISKREIEQIKITYPIDKEEQDYIVKTLDAIAEIIRLRKETIQLAKDLIPTIFQEMFGDPITNPKGWEILSLDNIITQINNGYNPSKKDFGTGIPFVTVNNLYDGLSIDYDSLDKVMVSNKQIQKYKLNYGDICFVRSSVKREGIGQASAYLSNQDAIFGGFVIRVTPKETFNPIFLSEYFQTESMRNIIINKSVTGVMTNINQPALLSIPVLNVPFSMQEEFADKVEQINKYIAAQQEELEQFETLFQSLLQEAFTGVLTWNYPRKECHDKKDK